MAKIRRSRKRKTKKHKPEGNPGIKSYIVGLCTSLIITFILTMLWAFVVRLSSISESSKNIFDIVILVVSVFCGGYVCTIGTGRNGLISGGVAGILYVLVLLILGSGLAQTDLSLTSLLYLGGSFIVGGIGGTVAINT